MKPVLEEPFVSREFRFCPNGEVGPLSTKLYRRIRAIQDGDAEDIHGWCRFVEV